MPLIAVLSLVLLFLGHSTLAGITGLIFALLFLAGFRHEKRILVLWAGDYACHAHTDPSFHGLQWHFQ